MAHSRTSQPNASKEVPTLVEDLVLEHDATCAWANQTLATVESELFRPAKEIDSSSLSESVRDVAAELSGLLRAKCESAFFSGFATAAEQTSAGVSQVVSSYRRVISALRKVQREVATGKPRKARRLLATWSDRLRQVIDRESELISELWSFENAPSAAA